MSTLKNRISSVGGGVYGNSDFLELTLLQKHKFRQAGIRGGCCNRNYCEGGFRGFLEDKEPWGGRFGLTQRPH